ncbi:MAG: GIY-YIG nuclease family protein [Firmicutes bacterium]|nr:GIY-YIG nuclease family protein [Bacillota bacterium]
MRDAIEASGACAQHFVYIVKCSDGTLYTGYAKDVEARIRAHNAGQGAKYTRGRLPVRLVYTEAHISKGSALRREQEIKAKSRAAKLRLIHAYEDISSRHKGGRP